MIFGKKSEKKKVRTLLPDFTLSLLARFILGGIFIYASMDKIIHPALFAEVVHNYQILPNVLINLTALVLPWLELVLGVMLVAGVWLPGAVFCGNFLLLTFSGLLIFNLSRGLNIDCGCFSTKPSTDPITLWTVLRDISFLIPALYLLFAKRVSGWPLGVYRPSWNVFKKMKPSR